MREVHSVSAACSERTKTQQQKEKLMWNTQITKTLSLRKRHHLGGGQERIDKQHAKGKMTARCV